MCLRMVAGVANVPFMVTTSDTETDSADTLYHCQVMMVLAYFKVFCIFSFTLQPVTGQMTGNFYNDCCLHFGGKMPSNVKEACMYSYLYLVFTWH